MLGRVASAISGEVNRNGGRMRYDPEKAAHRAYVKRKYAKYQGMKIVECDGLRAFVETALSAGRSPESIAGRVRKRMKHLPSVSGDSIARFLKSIYGRKIEARREREKKKRRVRRRRPSWKKLSNRRFIEKRPQSATKRKRVGDAEADFIESGKNGRGRLLVAVDRKLRVVFIARILPVSVRNITKAFLAIKCRYPELRTITTDNDILLDHHKELERLLGVLFYFCHPYHSWEKGTVENTNGEIRKYIPKGSDLSRYSPRFIRTVEKKLNDRYMECLNYHTPAEALDLHRKMKTTS